MNDGSKNMCKNESSFLPGAIVIESTSTGPEDYLYLWYVKRKPHYLNITVNLLHMFRDIMLEISYLKYHTYT